MTVLSSVWNTQTITLSEIPLFDIDTFAYELSGLLARKCRLCAYFGGVFASPVSTRSSQSE